MEVSRAAECCYQTARRAAGGGRVPALNPCSALTRVGHNRDGGGGASGDCEGGLATQARRAHPQLARSLLHPVRQWGPHGLQDAAREEQLPRPSKQVHGVRVPDHGGGQAAPLHVHHPRPAVDHIHRKKLLRRQREGPVSSLPFCLLNSIAVHTAHRCPQSNAHTLKQTLSTCSTITSAAMTSDLPVLSYGWCKHVMLESFVSCLKG